MSDICVNCGSVEGVSCRPDPFLQDVYNKIVMKNLCKKCYNSLCEEI